MKTDLFQFCGYYWVFQICWHIEYSTFAASSFRIWNRHISSVQSLSRVWLFVTPWTAAHQASLSITNSWSSLRLTSIESVMPSSHLILCCPLLLLPPIPPSIRVFSSASTLCTKWPKCWSFIDPSNYFNFLKQFKRHLLLFFSCFSYVWFFITLWTVAHQAPLSTEFYRRGYWSGLPHPPSRDFPNPGIHSESSVSCIGRRFLYH